MHIYSFFNGAATAKFQMLYSSPPPPWMPRFHPPAFTFQPRPGLARTSRPPRLPQPASPSPAPVSLFPNVCLASGTSRCHLSAFRHASACQQRRQPFPASLSSAHLENRKSQIESIALFLGQLLRGFFRNCASWVWGSCL